MIRVWLAALLVLFFTTRYAHSHDWYSDKVAPNGARCCGGKDCAPAPARLNADTGDVEIHLGGRWWSATNPAWYLGPSPTGEAAGCMMPSDDHPRCVWVGQGT